jgi:hypothetical protein
MIKMRIEQSMERLVLVYIAPTPTPSNAVPAVLDIHSLRCVKYKMSSTRPDDKPTTAEWHAPFQRIHITYPSIRFASFRFITSHHWARSVEKCTESACSSSQDSKPSEEPLSCSPSLNESFDQSAAEEKVIG